MPERCRCCCGATRWRDQRNALSRSRSSAAPTRPGWSAPSDTSMRCPARPMSFRARYRSPSISARLPMRTVPCAPWLKSQVSEAIAGAGYRVFELPSGAGHDGMAMIDIADVAMVFVRCRGGISHHPDEHTDTSDVDAGARVLLRLIENFRPRGAADSA